MRARLGIAIILGLVVCFGSVAFSGDYELTISDDPRAPCASQLASRDSLSNPIRTSVEVTQDIQRYFRGEKPHLAIFVAAFGNGHIHFCTKKEKREIQRALIKVTKQGVIKNENHLYDYLYMLGDKGALEMIVEELKASNQPGTKRRLLRAGKAVMKRYGQAKNST